MCPTENPLFHLDNFSRSNLNNVLQEPYNVLEADNYKLTAFARKRIGNLFSREAFLFTFSVIDALNKLGRKKDGWQEVNLADCRSGTKPVEVCLLQIMSPDTRLRKLEGLVVIAAGLNKAFILSRRGGGDVIGPFPFKDLGREFPAFPLLNNNPVQDFVKFWQSSSIVCRPVRHGILTSNIDLPPTVFYLSGLTSVIPLQPDKGPIHSFPAASGLFEAVDTKEPADFFRLAVKVSNLRPINEFLRNKGKYPYSFEYQWLQDMAAADRLLSELTK